MNNDNYVCIACGGVVSCSRREAHEELWCSAVADENELPVDVIARLPGEGFHGGARGTLSSLCEEITHVAITSLPGLHIALEQHDIWGSLDTGGALWYADRVLAEYLALTRLYGTGVDTTGLVLVLGCGGAPLSGLVAAAIGCDVVLTDLGEVVSLTQRNVDRNLDALSLARRSIGFASEAINIKVMELPFGDDNSLKTAIGSRNLKQNHDGEEPPLLVLCSDCVWQRSLHDLLLSTIVAALHTSLEAFAIICFQVRDLTCERDFCELAKQKSLDLELIEIGDVLRKVQWPTQVCGAMEAKGEELSEDFLMYRITLLKPS